MTRKQYEVNFDLNKFEKQLEKRDICERGMVKWELIEEEYYAGYDGDDNNRVAPKDFTKLEEYSLSNNPLVLAGKYCNKDGNVTSTVAFNVSCVESIERGSEEVPENALLELETFECSLGVRLAGGDLSKKCWKAVNQANVDTLEFVKVTVVPSHDGSGDLWLVCTVSEKLSLRVKTGKVEKRVASCFEYAHDICSDVLMSVVSRDCFGKRLRGASVAKKNSLDVLVSNAETER